MTDANLPVDQFDEFWHCFFCNIILSLETSFLVTQIDGIEPFIQRVVESIMQRPIKNFSKILKQVIVH